MIHGIGPAPTPSPSPTHAAQVAPKTVTGGHTELDVQLDLVARCVEARVATRVYSVSLGGFDLHADEKDAQQRQLGALDSAVSAFVDRMAVPTPAVRSWSRSTRSSAGGCARTPRTAPTTAPRSDFFLLGAPVRGGLYGHQPSLNDLDDGDLKYTTDFRDVYATLLGDVLDTDPGKVLAGWAGRLGGVLA